MPLRSRQARQLIAGTERAFVNDDRPEVYHEAAAMLTWDRTLTFLHDKLRSASRYTAAIVGTMEA